MVLYLYTEMLDCIPFTHFINIFAITTLLPVNLPPFQKMHVRVVRSYNVAFRYKKCVYMCLIDLLNDKQLQNGFTAIFEILNLNFEKINHSLGILQYVLL